MNRSVKTWAMVFVVLFLLTPLSVLAQGKEVVTSTGRAFFNDHMTPAEAKAIALNNARRNSLEKALGISPRGDTLVYDGSNIDEIIGLAPRGVISEEKIIESRWEPLEKGAMAWFTKIEATVTPIDRKGSKSFAITEVSVIRPGTEKSDTVFHPGEKVQVRTEATEKAFFQIFGIDQNGIVSRLFPVRFTEQELILAGEKFVFPTEHEMKFGLKIRVSTLKGIERSVESIMVIATKEKGRLLSRGHFEIGTLSDIMKELSSIDESKWAVKTVSYEVRE